MYPDTRTLFEYKKKQILCTLQYIWSLKKKKKANLKKPDKKDHILRLYLYKMHRIGNSIKAEGRLVTVYDIA